MAYLYNDHLVSHHKSSWTFVPTGVELIPPLIKDCRIKEAKHISSPPLHISNFVTSPRDGPVECEKALCFLLY
jgi:hypothetical protein